MLLFVIEQVSQSSGWHHVVVAANVDVVTMIGTGTVYFDGIRVGRTVLDGKFTSYPYNCACRFFHTTCKICIEIFKVLLFEILWRKRSHLYELLSGVLITFG